MVCLKLILANRYVRKYTPRSVDGATFWYRFQTLESDAVNRLSLEFTWRSRFDMDGLRGMTGDMPESVRTAWLRISIHSVWLFVSGLSFAKCRECSGSGMIIHIHSRPMRTVDWLAKNLEGRGEVQFQFGLRVKLFVCQYHTSTSHVLRDPLELMGTMRRSLWPSQATRVLYCS